MITIWKYAFEFKKNDHRKLGDGRWRWPIVVPKDAKILTVGTQGKAVCIWAMVETNSATEVRRLNIVSTGSLIAKRRPPTISVQQHIDRKSTGYLGTAVLKREAYHVFEWDVVKPS